MINTHIGHMEAGPCRRPYYIQLGSPAMREAHYKNLDTHGSQSMPEVISCILGKPDKAGGPMINTHIGYMEAGPCRRPCHIQLGSPTVPEAHCKDINTHGSRSMTEALLLLPVFGGLVIFFSSRTSSQKRLSVLLLHLLEQLLPHAHGGGPDRELPRSGKGTNSAMCAMIVSDRKRGGRSLSRRSRFRCRALAFWTGT